MPQYNNEQNISCDTSKCKFCKNKFGCSQYFNYLENIAQSSSNVSIMSSYNSTELTKHKEIKDLLNEILSNKFLIIENQNRLFQKSIDELIDGISKLYNFENNYENKELAIYTSKPNTEKMFIEKKGFLGLGKSKWVEEEIQVNNIETQDI